MATLRKIAEYQTEDSKYKFTVRRNPAFDEWQVTCYVFQKNRYVRCDEQAYHTSDKSDALQTAKHMRDCADIHWI